MGAVLSVVSQKGGVGKTTTAVNLAAAFARRGLKTLIVDVDPQGAVRYGVGLKPDHPTCGFADYLNGQRSLREIILPTALPWLRVILAGTVSDQADHSIYQQLIEETDLLTELLEKAQQRCHVVIVDTPPGLGSITRRALQGSQHVIVPLQCEPLALQTTPQILRAIQDVAESNDQLMLDGILLTMYEANSPTSERVVEYVRQHLPANILFKQTVPRTTAASDAFAAGQPVVIRTPADLASQAYINIATVLAERLGV
jgi:chromosome partitioning protein